MTGVSEAGVTLVQGIANLEADKDPTLGGILDTNGFQVQWSKGADVASATALPILTDGNYYDVTGTTTITSINTTGAVGTVIRLHFDGILTLTHSATDLVLPGAANITTAAGDEFTFVEYASGDFRCVAYALASGEAVVSGGGASSGTWTPQLSDGTNNATQSVTVGEFIKNGDLVYIGGSIRASSLGSMSGAIRITGLPFTSKNTTDLMATISFSEVTSVNITAGESMTAVINPNSTHFNIRLWDVAGGNGGMQTTELTATAFIRFSGSYIAAP